MKWILPISLIILLSFVSTFEIDNKAVNEKTVQKMVKHLTKIRNLFRNLEESDTGDSEPSDSNDSSDSSDENLSSPNSTETVVGTLPAPDVSTDNKDKASVQLISLNSFKTEKKRVIFNTFFIFTKGIPPKYIYFILTFLYKGSLRNLQEVKNAKNETAKCTIDDNAPKKETDESIKFNCESDKIENNEIEQIVANPDLQLEYENGTKTDVNSGDINFSEDAALALQNLQNQKQEIDKIYVLDNGELDQKSTYFFIKGDVKEYDGEKKDTLMLEVYDDSDKDNVKTISFPCIIEDKEDTKYKFKCTPNEDLNNAKIDLSPMSIDKYDGKRQITLNMTAPNSQKVTVNKPSDTRNNPIYKKSSSGLSGGAIAGIVISCAVALIIASVVAMMLRKPAAVPINNTSSVVGMRSVDNFTE